MQEEDLYLSIQAGSKPGGQSNRATHPKGGRQRIGGQNRQVRNNILNILESLAMTHRTIWQRK